MITRDQLHWGQKTQMCENSNMPLNSLVVDLISTVISM